jgi:hypothetical protein
MKLDFLFINLKTKGNNLITYIVNPENTFGDYILNVTYGFNASTTELPLT